MAWGSGVEGKGKVVCVTGASGFVGSWVVKLLLERGYTVRACVRDLADDKETQHLLAMNGSTERLHLFKADLLEEGSFDDGVKGCDGVFHIASPCYHNVTDPQVELVEPAVKGTLNVLASCKRSSIKRIVLTSSMGAMVYNGKRLAPDVVADETWWSSAEVCERDKQWYLLSKTLAENAAWKFSKENELDMITINPGMIIGPFLQPVLNASCAAILRFINGTPTYPNLSVGFVNVKDIAMAHILAFELPSASGRYCICERVVHYSEAVKIIHELYPNLPLPEKCADDKPPFPTYQISKEKSTSLGLDCIPLETSLKETIESLKEHNFVNF